MDAEQIVRALAAADPEYNSCPDRGDCLKCSLCGSELRMTYFPGGKTANAYTESNPHEDDCPWLLAREWVAATG